MNLAAETQREMFWMLLLSRRLDERAWILHRQVKIALHISSLGHEAAQRGAAFAIRLMVYLSLTFDHRILAGAGADGFLAKVVETLQNWS